MTSSHAAAASLSGRALLEALRSGALPPPPFAETMDIALVEVGDGRVVFEGRPDRRFLNPLGTVHGGWTAAILDSAMGCAVHALLAPGQTYTTTSLVVHYVRAILPPEDGAAPLLRCEGTAVHVGRRAATAEGRLLDAAGRVIAHGTEACLVMEGRG